VKLGEDEILPFVLTEILELTADSTVGEPKIPIPLILNRVVSKDPKLVTDILSSSIGLS
jgi:hypothetical protein